jgi:hypothetical protein
MLVATAFTLHIEWPKLSYLSDKVGDAIAASLYVLGTIAFLARRKFAPGILLLGLLAAVATITWGVSTRGFGPNFKDPILIVGRGLALCIMIAIVVYGIQLARRGFLR